MNKLLTATFFLMIVSLFPSCQLIGNIFSAGVWVGVIIVVVIIVILLMVFGKKSN